MDTQTFEKLETELSNATRAFDALRVSISKNDDVLEDAAREELALSDVLEIVTTRA